VIFQRDCGATTGFSTQISILSSDTELPNEHGSLLSFNGHPKDTKLSISWKSDDLVKVTSRVITIPSNISSVNGINITYK